MDSVAGTEALMSMTGEGTREAAMAALLDRIAAENPKVHAFEEVFADEALAEARRIDRAHAEGDPVGLLDGAPVGVKDIFDMAGHDTGFGAAGVTARRATRDAVAVSRVRQADGIVLGRLRMTEGAYGLHHPTRPAPVNPWGRDYWSGTSSSGSGVAVASGYCRIALGTDTGGSVRFPAAANGVVGLKPTAGRIPATGVLPLAPSLDTPGVLASSCGDAAKAFAALALPDDGDPVSLAPAIPFRPSRQPTILIDPSYTERGTDEAVRGAVRLACTWAEDCGFRIREAALPDTEPLIGAWYDLAAAEAALWHVATLGWGAYFAAFLKHGQSITASRVIIAEAERRRFRAGLAALLHDADALICPALFRSGLPHDFLSSPLTPEADVVSLMRFSAPFSFSGNPALVVPTGISGAGAPLSVQLVGRHGSDERLLEIGGMMEERRGPFPMPGPGVQR